MAKVAPLDRASPSCSSARSSQVSAHEAFAHGQAFATPTASGKAPVEHEPDSKRSIVHQARHSVRTILGHTGWYNSDMVQKTRRLLGGKWFAIAAVLALLVALFFGEVFAIAQAPGNTELDIVLTLVFALFAFEFLGLSLTDTSYLFGFFFWMDLIGTASMAFDISFMAGSDVTQPDRVDTAGAGANDVMIVRAARAAKLGARAGRISRVVKLVRFLPFLLRSEEQDAQKVKMARVISSQLTNVLSTRVAFLTICVVIVMPVFTMFTYPTVDDSMSAWTELLEQSAQEYHVAWTASNQVAIDTARTRLMSEVGRFSDFYSSLAYGPFQVLYGEVVGDDFLPDTAALDIDYTFRCTEPRRKSSIKIIRTDRIETWFDLSTPKQQEAAASIGLICFIILVMCCFGMVMSSSISVIALQPLERMLTVVRERCTQIFKYTSDLEDTSSEVNSDAEEEYDDMEQASEFALLEKVVAKLAAIAHLSASAQEPEMKADMNENELMVINWIQAAQVPASPGVVAKSPLFLHRSPISEDIGTSQDDVDILRGVASAHNLPPDLLESLSMATFNTLDLSKEMKMHVASHLVLTYQGSSSWVLANVKEAHLCNFVAVCEQKYMPNPFHNFAHAVDVEHSAFWYMTLIHAEDFLPEVAQFWLLVAAIGHDVGHLGVNNQYLVEIVHELALRYNDRSPLENMHCAKLFQITTEYEANIFSQIDKDLYKEIRKGIINAILHTDVTKHNEMIKELSMLYQMHSETFDALQPGTAVSQSQANTQLVMNALLHCADIGNPMKPWMLCRRIAYLCLDEFFAQGDLEKAAGIPVQMLNDREKVNRPNSQVGFIEFVIAPMVTVMVNMFPQLDSLAENLGNNIHRWSEVWQEESSPGAEAVAKVNVRVQKVVAQCGSLMRDNKDR